MGVGPGCEGVGVRGGVWQCRSVFLDWLAMYVANNIGSTLTGRLQPVVTLVLGFMQVGFTWVYFPNELPERISFGRRGCMACMPAMQMAVCGVPSGKGGGLPIELCRHASVNYV
jgi:di/tricarboxylate transporter